MKKNELISRMAAELRFNFEEYKKPFITITDFITAQIDINMYPLGLKGLTTSDSKQLAKKLKQNKIQESIKYFKEKYNGKLVKRSFAPTVQCQILDKSQPFENWSYYKYTQALQNIIFNLSENDFKLFKQTYILTKNSHNVLSNKYNLDNLHIDIQLLNACLKNSIAIYEGCVEKYINKIKKKNIKIKQNNSKFNRDEQLLNETAFDDNGLLIEHPGNTPILYGTQTCNLMANFPNKITTNIKSRDIKVKIPIYYKTSKQYVIKSGDGLIKDKSKFKFKSESDAGFNSKRRVCKKNKSIKLESIPVYAKFGNDWIIFDGRALLRQVYWRFPTTRGQITIEELLRYFTNNPVINPKTGNVSLSFNESVLSQITNKVIGYKKFNKPDNFILLSIDLGQNNICAYRLSLVNKINNKFIPKLIEKGVIPSETDIQKLRDDQDKIEEEIKNEAINSLEYKNEIKNFYNRNLAEETKYILNDKFGIPYDINYSAITNRTHIIADYLISHGKSEDAHFIARVKKSNNKKEKSKERKLKRTDLGFSKYFRPKLSKNIRSELNAKIWELKINSCKYKKLSQYKKEYIRSCVNSLIAKAKDIANKYGCILVNECTIIVNIENLSGQLSFFNGSGKGKNNWESFFLPKKENRFLIKNFYSAFYDLAKNKGVNVVESNKYYTSQRCPCCKYIDAKNRIGEFFNCKKCKKEFNADIDVATYNLEDVFLKGEPIKK